MQSESKTNLSVREAASYIGLSKSYLDKARVVGGGPAYSKFGSRIIYSISDLNSWRDANKRSSTSVTLNG